MSWRSEEVWNGSRRALQGGKYEWEDPPKRDKRRKREEARRRAEKEAVERSATDLVDTDRLLDRVEEHVLVVPGGLPHREAE